MGAAEESSPTFPEMDPALAKRLATVVRRLQELGDERDQLILEAREQGASLRDIADLAGMSHVGIKKLIGRHLHPVVLEQMDDELPDDPEVEAKRELNRRLNRQRTADATKETPKQR